VRPQESTKHEQLFKLTSNATATRTKPRRDDNWWSQLHGTISNDAIAQISPSTAYESSLHPLNTLIQWHTGCWTAPRFHATMRQLFRGSVRKWAGDQEQTDVCVTNQSPVDSRNKSTSNAAVKHISRESSQSRTASFHCETHVWLLCQWNMVLGQAAGNDVAQMTQSYANPLHKQHSAINFVITICWKDSWNADSKVSSAATMVARHSGVWHYTCTQIYPQYGVQSQQSSVHIFMQPSGWQVLAKRRPIHSENIFTTISRRNADGPPTHSYQPLSGVRSAYWVLNGTENIGPHCCVLRGVRGDVHGAAVNAKSLLLSAPYCI